MTPYGGAAARGRSGSRRSGTLVFDGDCGFCTSSVRLLHRVGLAPGAAVVPWQRADLARLGLTREQCEQAVQWVAADGRTDSGARAVAGVLLASPPPWPVLGAALRVPPLSWLAAAVYRWGAAHRGRLPGGTPACAAPPHLTR